MIRHAQPAWVVDGVGYNDPDLSELGQAQADAVGKALAPLDFHEIWVSPARRSQQTAEAILRHHDSTVLTRDWALEIQFPPAWDGSPVEQIQEWLATARDRDRERWWDATEPHGGESFRSFHHRVTYGLEDELARRGITRVDDEPDMWDIDDDDRRKVALITHAGTNSVVLGHLLGLAPQPWEWERFSSAHASVSILRHRPIAAAAIFALRSFSATEHLRDVGVTR